eukprot:CAMPEP_0172628800 /NCGR_PEP_ID=MMETSP1068-20121228/163928_1 /TAXON_ID=35684 /ORGANISM="Pseudopedinella elastica, Strain CCMP716" /LENGTH=157 /DNA_ID=CAMNT_0013439145 /DNA_START=8 /DNA_END=477 /DNA_ORIENTATION=+
MSSCPLFLVSAWLLLGACGGGWLGVEYADQGGLEYTVRAGESAAEEISRFCARQRLSPDKCRSLKVGMAHRHLNVDFSEPNSSASSASSTAGPEPSPYSIRHTLLAEPAVCHVFELFLGQPASAANLTFDHLDDLGALAKQTCERTMDPQQFPPHDR